MIKAEEDELDDEDPFADLRDTSAAAPAVAPQPATGHEPQQTPHAAV